jgi:hypothetical protein
MHSQDLSKIDTLKWGATATGSIIDWCLTPGIKGKATSATSLYTPMGYKSLEIWATIKYFLGPFLTSPLAPRGEICPLGGKFTPLFTPRGEHSLQTVLKNGGANREFHPRPRV